MQHSLPPPQEIFDMTAKPVLRHSDLAALAAFVVDGLVVIFRSQGRELTSALEDVMPWLSRPCRGESKSRSS